jgi:hypothetical protein
VARLALAHEEGLSSRTVAVLADVAIRQRRLHQGPHARHVFVVHRRPRHLEIVQVVRIHPLFAHELHDVPDLGGIEVGREIRMSAIRAGIHRAAPGRRDQIVQLLVRVGRRGEAQVHARHVRTSRRSGADAGSTRVGASVTEPIPSVARLATDEVRAGRDAILSQRPLSGGCRHEPLAVRRPALDSVGSGVRGRSWTGPVLARVTRRPRLALRARVTRRPRLALRARVTRRPRLALRARVTRRPGLALRTGCPIFPAATGRERNDAKTGSRGADNRFHFVILRWASREQ